MTFNELFLAGAIGAIAPEIVRLYEIRTDAKLKFSWFYVVISIAYVALGGYISTIFPGIEKPFWAACVGAGLVLVVNKMVYIGGRMADHVGSLVKGPPGQQAAGKKSFAHGSAENGEPRRAGFIDFIGKL